MTLLLGLLICCSTVKADLTDISNYVEYSDSFSSSGQPNGEQLQDAWVAGFERVIYIAFSDHETSLGGEDRIAKELGMDYVNIPVNWGSPAATDFNMFASVMNSEPKKKTLLHCQVNFRASSFSFLYRVIYNDIPVAIAKKDLNSVWTPNGVWTAFILQVLEQHDISSSCEGCDWTPQQH